MALYLVKSEMPKAQAKRERSRLGRRTRRLDIVRQIQVQNKALRRRKYLDEIAQCLLRLNVLLGYLREHDEQKSETPGLRSKTPRQKRRARRRAEERDDENNDPWDGYPWNA